MTVDPEVSSATGRPGVLGHLRWHARRYRRLLSEIEADLIVCSTVAPFTVRVARAMAEAATEGRCNASASHAVTKEAA